MKQVKLNLYPHNKIAYKKANDLLEKVGRAAVIHPTGTGKSLIAFQIAFDHPDKKVLWLSPSDYIFRMQCENIYAMKVTKDKLNNIQFMTYLQLLLQIEEIPELRPDYIILDEFHRCGAPEWGKGVRGLLDEYPKAKLMGLSATNIRYLDNQRDMAEELFNGIIASEMTLGEAIVKGILPSATYVMSMYKYQDEYKKIENKVANTRNKKAKAENERLLEQLKRALEHAAGLNEVFNKYITKKDGKFIMFCTDREHMLEMEEHIGEWFGDIDAKPHVYKVFFDDAYSSEEFRMFRKDTSSHLKLLLCINMLNEGIHVADVDGVILLRPTVSPVIFLQQIGRALTAGDAKQPIIFDIVNNFESLNSIDALVSEFDNAFFEGRKNGEKNKFQEEFQIIDEVKECKELFERIKKNLRSGWDFYYKEAKAYYMKNGNLRVPRRYVTKSGLQLGSWIVIQRRTYRGETGYLLTDEQVDKLNAIGMEWDSIHEISWNANYERLKEYSEKYGSTIIRRDHDFEEIESLVAWTNAQRLKYRQNKRERLMSEEQRNEGVPVGYLSEEQEQLLNAIGMIWEPKIYEWNRNYEALKKYHDEHGDIILPHKYVTKDGIHLYTWLTNQKTKYRQKAKGEEILTSEQVTLLEELGIVWDASRNSWEKGIAHVKEYFSEFGNLNCPAEYISKDGFGLGKWLNRMRSLKRKGMLSDDEISMLEYYGFVWEPQTNQWLHMYQILKDYYEKHGNCKILLHYKTEDGVLLGAWVDKQRRLLAEDYSRYKTMLTNEQKELLAEVGIDPKKMSHKDELWERGYEELLLYKEAFGKADIIGDYVTPSGYKLSNWMQAQRTRMRKGEVTPEQEDRLNQIGFVWDKSDQQWISRYEYAKKYYKEHGHCRIPQNYKTEDGFSLGWWLADARESCRNADTEIKENRKKLLSELGITWDKNEDVVWDNALVMLEEYKKVHGDIVIPRNYIMDNGYNIGNYLTQLRDKKKKGKLSEEKTAILDAMGMVWNLQEYRWQRSFEELVKYKEEFGHVNVPYTYKTNSGYSLGNWVAEQKKKIKNGTKLDENQAKLLDKIGLNC